MRSCRIASRATILLVWLCLIPHTPALAARPGFANHPVWLRAYGLFSPSFLGSNNQTADRWGAGGAIQWGFNSSWALSLDVSSMPVDGKRVRPVLTGLVFGPGGSARLRPWIEVGAGYYQTLEHPSVSDQRGLANGGYPRDFFQRAVSGSREDALGGYFGAGLGLRVTSQLSVSAGARFHSWIGFLNQPFRFQDWDGMGLAQSGLTYRF